MCSEPAVPGPFRGRSGSGQPGSRASVSPRYPRAAASRLARAPAPSSAPSAAIGRRACHSSRRVFTEVQSRRAGGREEGCGCAQ